ncbi:MAG: AraC family transcriptional regulator, partial [Bacteroidota bacterium]
VIVLRRGEHEQTPWLRNTLGFIACEARSGRLGASALVGHLSNVLFIQAIRAHVAQTDAPAQGWLRGLMDPHIAPALAQIQQRPDASWTVESLAYEARLSRSAFSNRFRDVVGEPPMTFLTRWRMLEAARLLRTRRSDTLADVSALVGYESEASFSRTFKRVIGQSPGRYRSAARRTGLLV